MTESQQDKNTEIDEISLKEVILKVQEWWRYLLSKWMIIVAFGLFGGILGFSYAYFKKPIFTATTTFVLEDEKSGSNGLGNLAGLASMAGVDLNGGGGGIFQGDNILRFYKSRTMLERTLLTPVSIAKKEELLIDRYIEINNLRNKWADNKKLQEISFLKYADTEQSKPNRLRDSVLGSIVNDIMKNYLVIVKPDKKLSEIQVDVKATDEVFAKEFNDALVKNVNEFYINTKTKKTLANVRILQHKTDSVRAVMNGAIYTAVAVADATPNLNPTRQIQRVAPAQKAQFNAETNKAILGSLVQNLEMTKMTLLKEAPLLEIIDRPIHPLPKETIGKIKGFLIGFVTLIILASCLMLLAKFFKRLMM